MVTAVVGVKMLAILAALAGVVSMFYVWRRCPNPDKRRMMVMSAVNLLYFAALYAVSLFRTDYIIRTGILTIIGVIVLIITFVIYLFVDMAECHE